VRKEMIMKHDKHFEDLLMLYFYDELSDSERAGFKDHIDECPVCQAEIERLQAIEKQIDRVPLPAPTPQLLTEMNRRIMLELTGRERQPTMAKIKDLIEDIFDSVAITMARPRYQLIAVGLTFVIGIFVGKLWLSTGLRHNPEMLANLVNYNYQLTPTEKEDVQKAFAGYLLKSGGIEAADLLQADQGTNSSGLVEVNVKVEKNLAIKGGLDDPTIQNMLMYAARQEPDKERRLRAVRLLGQVTPRPEVDETLAAVMLRDAAEPIRLLAAQLLDERAMTGQRMEAYKSVVLNDSSATIRKLALEKLVGQDDPGIVPVIALVAARDEADEIRQMARDALDDLYKNNNQAQK